MQGLNYGSQMKTPNIPPFNGWRGITKRLQHPTSRDPVLQTESLIIQPGQLGAKYVHPLRPSRLPDRVYTTLGYCPIYRTGSQSTPVPRKPHVHTAVSRKDHDSNRGLYNYSIKVG